MKIFYPSGTAEMSLSPEFQDLMRPCPQHTLERSSTLPTLLGLIRGMEVQTVTIACPPLWTSLSIPAQPPCSCDQRSSLPQKNPSWSLPQFLSSQQRDLHWSLAASEHPAHGDCSSFVPLLPSYIHPSSEQKGIPGTGTQQSCPQSWCKGFPQPWSCL